MNDAPDTGLDANASEDQPPPRKVGAGPWVLGAATVVALAVVAWGIGSGAPAASTAVKKSDPQYQKVTRGDLVESTTVQGTVSSGEIISLVVPSSSTTTSGSASGGSGAAGAAPSGGGGFPSGGGTRPSGPTTTARPSPTTVPPGPPTTPAPTTTTVPPTSAPPTTTAGAVAAPAAAQADTNPVVPARVASARLVSTRTVAPVAATAVATLATASRATTSTTAPPTGTSSGGASGAAPGGAIGSGTLVLTSVAAVGTVLHSGDTAFSVNGRPTVVVTGTTPAWRTINSSTSDGVDVEQLEAFLSSEGFTAGGALEVDGHMSSATTTAIKAWQKSLGQTQSGTVPLGEVVFQPADVTVVSVALTVGEVVTAGETVMEVRRGVPYVDVSTDESWAKVGEKVTTSIGSGRTQGTVVSLVNGIARVELPVDAGAKDGETATVTLTRTKVADQLLVPASALLLTDLQGPLVGVRTADGLRQVQVKVLASTGGNAAVRPVRPGTLSAGDTVRSY